MSVSIDSIVYYPHATMWAEEGTTPKLRVSYRIVDGDEQPYIQKSEFSGEALADSDLAAALATIEAYLMRQAGALAD